MGVVANNVWYLDLPLPMQSVHIATEVVSANIYSFISDVSFDLITNLE